MAKTNGGRVHPKRAEIVRKRADLRPLQRQAVRLIVEEPRRRAGGDRKASAGLIARCCVEVASP